MELVNRVWRSSLGKKYLMALSGCVLFLFVLGHMIGNLQVFLGPEAINRYAHFLQSNVELLWPVRVCLLAMVVLHIVCAIRLSLENKAARPVGYACVDPVEASYASRTMLISGIIVAVFIVYHLLHFTVRVPAVNLTRQDFAAFKDVAQQPDVFKMVVAGFNKPLVSVFYLLGVGLLCLHLRHGFQAWLQTLGFRNDSWRCLVDRLAWVVAIGLFAGYCSIPLAILLGFGKEALK